MTGHIHLEEKYMEESRYKNKYLFKTIRAFNTADKSKRLR